jgi:hypothetical protein
MKTPAGSECKFFFGDYYRGRSREECRLLGAEWKRDLCRACPVPSIGMANACQHMQLKAQVNRSIFKAFQRRVNVQASCEKTGRAGFDPHIGCGECHPLPGIFEVSK